MTPAEFRTYHDALGVSADFVASEIGVHINMIGRYESPTRRLPVPDQAADVMRHLVTSWDAAADRLAAQCRRPGVDVIPRHVELETFYERVPELRGWGVVAQGLLLAEVQRRVQLGIEYVMT